MMGSADDVEPEASTAREYPLERSDAETERLMLQERVIGSTTIRFFAKAGIAEGMHVLDVGSGAGDVSVLLAGLVGPTGLVHGIEMDERSVEVASRRAAQLGLDNVSFVAADASTVEVSGRYDAVVGRLVLMHLSDPTAVLHRLSGSLPKGGLVAFQEAHLAAPWLSFPVSESLSVVQQARENALRGGQVVNPYMGLGLRQAFVLAGLGDPEIHTELAIGGDRSEDACQLVEATVRSLLPGWKRRNIEGASEINPEGLAQRIRNEIGDYGTITLYPLIGASVRVR